MQKIGFMQGRLLPKYNGQFQCHPKDWLEEFRLANSNQYHYIEWIIDKQSKDFNPLLNDQGRLMILKASNEYQIKINSICADILLQNIIKDEIDAKYWLKNIISIINAAYIIKCKIIVVPLIERMTLKNKNLRKVIIDIFKKLLPKKLNISGTDNNNIDKNPYFKNFSWKIILNSFIPGMIKRDRPIQLNGISKIL